MPVTCPLYRPAWEFYLADYPDRNFLKSLLHIIQFGANIGFIGAHHPQQCKNLRSALDHPSIVDNDIRTLAAHSHISGPFHAPPLLNFCCSPLGVVAHGKHQPSKFRVINHLSWPEGGSINDGIPDTEVSIAYDSFHCAVDDLRTLGPGTLLAKLDLKDAFRHIPIRSADWHLFGFLWSDQFYYLLVLAFGLKTAPYVFNLFAEALHWVIERHIPLRICHYLDDFLLAFAPLLPLPVAVAAVEWVMALGRALGLFFQDTKTVWPCTCLEFLGLELDSIAMEAGVPISWPICFLYSATGAPVVPALRRTSRSWWATCSSVPRWYHTHASTCADLSTSSHCSLAPVHAALFSNPLAGTCIGGNAFPSSGTV